MFYYNKDYWVSLFSKKDLNTFKKMLEEGLDPNYFVNSGGDSRLSTYSVRERILFIACSLGFYEGASTLIQFGADVNSLHEKYGGQRDDGTRDKYVSSALIVASGGGHLELVKLLVKNGALINYARCTDSAIIEASRNGHYNIVEFLVNNGAEVYERSWKNEYPLDVAAWNNHINIVQYLIKQRGDSESDEKTALCSAIEAASKKGNNILLEFLFSVDEKLINSPELTEAFNNCLKFNDWYSFDDETERIEPVVPYDIQFGIINSFLKNGAVIDISTIDNLISYERNDLFRFLFNEKPEVRKIILENQSDLACNAIDRDNREIYYEFFAPLDDKPGKKWKKQGYRVLKDAIKNKNDELVKLVLDLGYNPNYKDQESGYEKPLISIASIEGNYFAVEYLIKSGANVNVVDVEGKNPLIDIIFIYSDFIYETHFKIIDLLIANGVNINYRVTVYGYTDSNFKFMYADSTVLEIAKNKRKPKKILDFLVSRGAKT